MIDIVTNVHDAATRTEADRGQQSRAIVMQHENAVAVRFSLSLRGSPNDRFCRSSVMTSWAGTSSGKPRPTRLGRHRIGAIRTWCWPFRRGRTASRCCEQCSRSKSRLRRSWQSYCRPFQSRCSRRRGGCGSSLAGRAYVDRLELPSGLRSSKRAVGIVARPRRWLGSCGPCRPLSISARNCRKNWGAVMSRSPTLLNDQVETVLHRVLRGTGLDGLAGIPRHRPMSPTVTLVRPLLSANRRGDPAVPLGYRPGLPH